MPDGILEINPLLPDGTHSNSINYTFLDDAEYIDHIKADMREMFKVAHDIETNPIITHHQDIFVGCIPILRFYPYPGKDDMRIDVVYFFNTECPIRVYFFGMEEIAANGTCLINVDSSYEETIIDLFAEFAKRMEETEYQTPYEAIQNVMSGVNHGCNS